MAAYVAPFAGDLVDEVRRLAAQHRFDHLVIEATGIFEPLPIAAAFSYIDERGVSLNDAARIDSMITVVDTGRIATDFWSHDLIGQRETSVSPGGQENYRGALGGSDRICRVIVLNKISDATPQERAAALFGAAGP